MKALVYTGTNESVYRDEPEPEALPGDVIVRVEAVGICGSDMHAWHGHDPRRVPPLILGHEGCGVITEGAGVGNRVVFNPLITCGTCEACLSGRTNLCAARELIGMRLPGAFADLIALPEKNVIPVPDGMTPADAALTEPCATAWHALKLAKRASWKPIPECNTLVIGGGSVGLLGGLILRAWGAKSVVVAETNPLRRETVAQTGLSVIDPIAAPVKTAQFDIIMDAVGSEITRGTSISAIKPGGVISHVGLQDWAGSFDARTATLSEVTWLGIYTYTEEDLKESLHALHDGQLGKFDWVEQRSLSDGAKAFEDLDAGRTSAAKIALIP